MTIGKWRLPPTFRQHSLRTTLSRSGDRVGQKARVSRRTLRRSEGRRSVTAQAALSVSRATPDTHPSAMLDICGTGLVLDLAGVAYWPDESMLAVADLHLEKGSSFAARGMLLPPYDTAATLARLGRTIARHAPRMV